MVTQIQYGFAQAASPDRAISSIPKERLVGIVFMQAPSQRTAYHAEMRALLYATLGDASRD